MNKQCSKCGGPPKPLTEFGRDASRPSGYRPHCKACARAREIVWYEANRERILARMAERRSADEEHFRRMARESYLRRRGVLPRKNSPEYLADRTDYPDCFSSLEQYRAWVIAARQAPPGKSEYCADCTAEYQSAMIKEGRCAYSNAAFVDGNGERQQRAVCGAQPGERAEQPDLRSPDAPQPDCEAA